MQTETIENTVNKLYKLPPVQLENAVRYIDELFKVSVEPTYFTDSKTNDFTTYLADWRERNKDILTDDDLWANVRDKNDFGREPVSWED